MTNKKLGVAKVQLAFWCNWLWKVLRSCDTSSLHDMSSLLFMGIRHDRAQSGINAFRKGLLCFLNQRLLWDYFAFSVTLQQEMIMSIQTGGSALIAYLHSGAIPDQQRPLGLSRNLHFVNATICAVGLDILEFEQTSLFYSASYFNFGGGFGVLFRRGQALKSSLRGNWTVCQNCSLLFIAIDSEKYLGYAICQSCMVCQTSCL